MHDHVGDVAVDEELPRLQADDLVGRHPAVGASDPQVARGLLARETLEEVGVVALTDSAQARLFSNRCGKVFKGVPRQGVRAR